MTKEAQKVRLNDLVGNLIKMENHTLSQPKLYQKDVNPVIENLNCVLEEEDEDSLKIIDAKEPIEKLKIYKSMSFGDKKT